MHEATLKEFFTVANSLGLSSSEQVRILNASTGHLGETTRLLRAIQRKLGQLVSDDFENIHHWVHCENDYFEGKSPLTYFDSPAGLETVLNYLNFFN
ncbi:antitoxin Xre/MbcA/ParS toxin-binding domain-containing protein [Marinobacter alexandrii]|uniref:antitoxin Xre/MbcA/ParS toxin-binding domain-containing protein n=1 Tax=Marinobacter alexandrii TaxID=2570351 RepID=UPI001108189E|nr:antitoxin Xre/MbcA/ParS toxin-binding domain-containing protein [Marinobacter alexandrii]